MSSPVAEQIALLREHAVLLEERLDLLLQERADLNQHLALVQKHEELLLRVAVLEHEELLRQVAVLQTVKKDRERDALEAVKQEYEEVVEDEQGSWTLRYKQECKVKAKL